MPNEIIHYPNDEKTVYLSYQAAYIASVSLDFLMACEQEGLITPQFKVEGRSGYMMKDIHRLQIIRRLHEDLHLALPAIDVILHLRGQIREMAGQRSYLERKLLEQQAELNRLQNLLYKFQSPG